MPNKVPGQQDTNKNVEGSSQKPHVRLWGGRNLCLDRSSVGEKLKSQPNIDEIRQEPLAQLEGVHWHNYKDAVGAESYFLQIQESDRASLQ